MTLPRRKFLSLATAAIGLPALSRAAHAETYPARPVRMLVGFAAGGAPDIAARLVAQWLSDRLGQQFGLAVFLAFRGPLRGNRGRSGQGAEGFLPHCI